MAYLYEAFLGVVNLVSVIGMIFVVMFAILLIAALMIVIDEEIKDWKERRRDK